MIGYIKNTQRLRYVPFTPPDEDAAVPQVRLFRSIRSPKTIHRHIKTPLESPEHRWVVIQQSNTKGITGGAGLCWKVCSSDPEPPNSQRQQEQLLHLLTSLSPEPKSDRTKRKPPPDTSRSQQSVLVTSHYCLCLLFSFHSHSPEGLQLRLCGQFLFSCSNSLS